MTGPDRTQALAPVVMTFVAAILWGLWWIPVRYLGALGLSGSQVTILTNIGAILLLGGWMVVTRRRMRISPRALGGALLIGAALSCYSISLALTDVIRAILLLYLAPAWSKIIEWAMLGRPWRHSTSLTLGIAIFGAFLVLGGDLSLAGFGIGDGVAIAAGVFWAIGATLLFTEGSASAAAVTLATLAFSVVIAAGSMLSLGEALPQAPSLPVLVTGLGLGGAYILLVMLLTLWSAQRLSPALLSFLFTLEILSGVISSALLLDERLGPAQMLGAALIMSAALIEVMIALRARSARVV